MVTMSGETEIETERITALGRDFSGLSLAHSRFSVGLYTSRLLSNIR